MGPCKPLVCAGRARKERKAFAGGTSPGTCGLPPWRAADSHGETKGRQEFVFHSYRTGIAARG